MRWDADEVERMGPGYQTSIVLVDLVLRKDLHDLVIVDAFFVHAHFSVRVCHHGHDHVQQQDHVAEQEANQSEMTNVLFYRVFIIDIEDGEIVVTKARIE